MFKRNAEITRSNYFEFTEFTEGHQHRGIDGLAGTDYCQIQPNVLNIDISRCFRLQFS